MTCFSTIVQPSTFSPTSWLNLDLTVLVNMLSFELITPARSQRISARHESSNRVQWS